MYLAVEGARVRDGIGGSAPAPRGLAIPNRNEQFGFRGDPPTHPALLDYLAVKFV